MKKLSKGAINWIRKNEVRIKEYTERAEKALFVTQDMYEFFYCVTKVHQFKDIIRMLRHETQHKISYTDVQDKWNKIRLTYGTKEEYAIWNTQNFNIMMSM